MNRLHFILLLTVSICCSCKNKSGDTIKESYHFSLLDSTSTVLSLIYPHGEAYQKNDLIIFGVITQSKFHQIVDFDRKKKAKTLQRDSILAEVKKFYFCNKQDNQEIKVDSLLDVNYECKKIKVGRCKSAVRIEKIMVATSRNWPCEKYYESFDEKTKDSLFKQFTDLPELAHLKENNAADKTLVYSINKTNDILLITQNDKAQVLKSTLFFLKKTGKIYSVINSFSKDIENGNFGHGYNLLDIKDIDNDGIPEVIVLFYAPNQTNIIILKKEKKKYRSKLETELFGC